MNYSEMSDFEVNLAAAHIALGVDGYDWSKEKQEVYIAGMDGGDFLPKAHFNPCKSWSDAGIFIEDYQISLYAIYEGGPRWLSFAGDDGQFRHVDSNPRRAAMIVFLRMQENSNA